VQHNITGDIAVTFKCPCIKDIYARRLQIIEQNFQNQPESGLRATTQDGIDSVVGKRGLFMCRIASHFLLQDLKGSMSGDARDFNNIET
jgi:hypothetical protein